MRESRVKEIIREVIEELYNGNHNLYPMVPTKFPYGDDQEKVLPNEINTDTHYIVDNSSENKETYTWPQKEFDLGMSIEQKRSPRLSMFDHAEMVIKNLRDDQQFYTKINQTT